MKDKFQTFVFEKYEIENEDGLKISLYYSFDGEEKFVEKLDFGKVPDIFAKQKFRDDSNINSQILDRAAFILHLIAGVSYFKAVVPKEMIVKSGKLTPVLKDFCEKLYGVGMGEFYYKNGVVDWALRGSFPEVDGIPDPFLQSGQVIFAAQKFRDDGGSDKVLLPLGGGKDSIVAALLLKDGGYEVQPITAKAEGPMRAVSQIMGEELWEVERQMDAKLFKWNEQGALNGHIPITAINSAVTVIAALLKGYRYIAFANERSADYGNLRWGGIDVNHQWSKSLEFEKMFAEIINQEINPDLKYFSLLRPLSEYHIVKIFAECAEKYFLVFRSCNRNFRMQGREEGWCQQCSKCTFVFAMMAAWLGLEKATEIFGKNMLADESLLPLWRELLGLDKVKPFECVGEPNEVACALWRTIRDPRLTINVSGGVEILMKEFEGKNPDFDFEKAEKELLTPSTEHMAPAEFQAIIDKLR